jgi:hypothetical protein
MTVHADGRVEVYLALLPARWTYVLGGIADYNAKMMDHCCSSVPSEEQQRRKKSRKNQVYAAVWIEKY